MTATGSLMLSNRPTAMKASHAANCLRSFRGEPAYTPDVLHDAEPAPLLNFMKLYRIVATEGSTFRLSDRQSWRFVIESRAAYKVHIAKLRYKWFELEDVVAYQQQLDQVIACLILS